MKTQEIQPGRTYHDGKQGVREVLCVEGDHVRYRLLAAKVERQFDALGGEKSLLGAETSMTLSAFAAWAKVGYDAQEAALILLALKAATIKLSPGEAAFLESVWAEALGTPVMEGTLVSYDHTEGRAMSGLEKKGLLRRVGEGEVCLLALGAARIRQPAESNLARARGFKP
ncbi:hypothetical protein CBP36_20165 (plasmid) [Acidovorax carolinensis]|uniref:Uncharacterized protein n=1 Tax=Acidovorax carolinensis TaxID=553814 RepID=A0A240UJQ6_9BURK|nr:hypothetical protein [Acidovorax carolinensis]ART57225.1 hypothetical protein CBP35_20145 [Acidovorax carolinensis]ART61055.1 hypothetical protein CBP36_18930 [Acidovorax carolinensis]ART61282.1 hypothetical protein CBP36_20165 [Acidovorax carolinensis]